MSRVITVIVQVLVADEVAASRRNLITRGVAKFVADGIAEGDQKNLNCRDVEGFKVTQADPYEKEFRIGMTAPAGTGNDFDADYD